MGTKRGRQTANIEKRVSDLEQMVDSIPDILNVRFSRIDRELAEIKEQQAVHTQRFTTLERKVETLNKKLALGFGEMMGEIKGVKGEIAALRQLLEERLLKT